MRKLNKKGKGWFVAGAIVVAYKSQLRRKTALKRVDDDDDDDDTACQSSILPQSHGSASMNLKNKPIKPSRSARNKPDITLRERTEESHQASHHA